LSFLPQKLQGGCGAFEGTTKFVNKFSCDRLKDDGAFLAIRQRDIDAHASTKAKPGTYWGGENYLAFGANSGGKDFGLLWSAHSHTNILPGCKTSMQWIVPFWYVHRTLPVTITDFSGSSG
jgi:hypothetical protein